MKYLNKGQLEKRHRLIILTDMENEPDDSQTMVRLLMYSNEIDIEGLIAVTSLWLDTVYPESIKDRVDAYGIVRENLVKHAPGWPTLEYLQSKVAGGQQGYGMDGVGRGKNTKGSDLIIEAVDKDDERPVWFAINAGANTLAQALFDVKNSRSQEEIDKFVSKIRVYDDSGQDNAGAWMCHEFPNLFYIRSRAQVFGLFGPHLGSGPQPWEPLDQHDFAEKNIRTRHGILGALYPQRIMYKHNRKFDFMEGGGTTTWLGLVNKGLFVPEEITWGGWGGRFSLEKEQVEAGQGNAKKLEEEFYPFYMYPQAPDYSWKWNEDKEYYAFSGINDKKVAYTSKDFAPLWRFREAYTNDFVARMDWCVSDYAHANHNPVAVFMGDKNRAIVRLEAKCNERIVLDASESFDPDGDLLSFKWSAYNEAGTYLGEIEIEDNDKSVAYYKVPKDAYNKQIHIILEVSDNNKIKMTSYRRIVIDVTEDCI